MKAIINNDPKMKWSNKVTKNSNALDLEDKIFTSENPQKIAKSLLNSAIKSRRKKGTSYQSAMSMLNFYINRAGSNLSKKTIIILHKAKKELRKLRT